jgi:hypothetical protein
MALLARINWGFKRFRKLSRGKKDASIYEEESYSSNVSRKPILDTGSMRIQE